MANICRSAQEVSCSPGDAHAQYFASVHNMPLTDKAVFALMRLDELATIPRVMHEEIGEGFSEERIRVVSGVCRWIFGESCGIPMLTIGIRMKYCNYDSQSKKKGERYSANVISQSSRPPYIRDEVCGRITTTTTILIRDWFATPFDVDALYAGLDHCHSTPFLASQTLQKAKSHMRTTFCERRGSRISR
jgi:hypothetical protein